MSSAISIEERRNDDAGLRPWQFFLLAGMLSATAVVLVSAGQSAASIIVLSLTVVAASFVALGAYRSLAPLVVPQAAEPPALIVGHTRAALEREKTLVLRTIKELDFDFAMKKIAKNDYDELSARLRARAIRLMRQLESDGGYREQIERELRLRMGVSDASGAPALPAVAPSGAKAGASRAPALPAVAPSGAKAGASRAGPAQALRCVCGTDNDPDARFCKNCGNKLAVASHA